MRFTAMDESALIDLLKGLPLHPGARGLADDAAVFAPPLGRDLVVTHDVLVEGVHYLPADPASDVAWKLLAVNLSDLAAKGAAPLGVLMGLTLAGDGAWEHDFITGLGRALGHFGVRLLGGDTVSGAGRRVLGLTAIGMAEPGASPARNGAKPGDTIYVTGTIGDAGLGLAVAAGMLSGDGDRLLLRRYRRPSPRLAEGRALGGHVHAMMDISDGLLIDAGRMAHASSVRFEVDLAAVPLSLQAVRLGGGDRAARLAAATAGDDYELLFTAPSHIMDRLGMAGITAVGRVVSGEGLTLSDKQGDVPLPDRLGFEHQG